uniref:DUF3730 domain-containing protein n=1 Tax=Syphacia muris TaxID=451379 RepID=A0A158R518_9BILA
MERTATCIACPVNGNDAVSGGFRSRSILLKHSCPSKGFVIVIVYFIGFSGLLRTLFSENVNSKEKNKCHIFVFNIIGVKNYINYWLFRNAAKCVLWKILHHGSPLCASWLVQAVPALIEKNVITNEEVINECFYIFSDGQNISQASELLLSLSNDYNQVVLHGLSLLPVQKRRSFLSRLLCAPMEKSFGCLMRLVFGDELLEDEKQLIILHILKSTDQEHIDTISRTLSCSYHQLLHYAVESPLMNRMMLKYCEDERVLLSLNLNYTNSIFDLCERIINGPHQCLLALVSNPSFPTHSSLVYPLLNAYASLSEWKKVPFSPSLSKQFECNNMSMEKIIQKISLLIQRSQNIKLKDDTLVPIKHGARTLFDYFNWIADSRQKINSSLTFWRKYSICSVSNIQICFICSFLPFLSDDQFDDYLSLLGQFVRTAPYLADGVLIFCLQLMKKSVESRKKFISWMHNLAVSKTAHGSVCKLLLTVAKSKDVAESVMAIKCLENLWNFSRWSSFDEFENVLKIDLSQSKSICLAKFSLIRSVCKKSDRSEELLPMLSALLNSNNEYLFETISVVIELCAAQILEMPSVLELFSPLASASQQTNVICGYIKLLALPSGLPIEEPDNRPDCIKLLWQYTSEENTPEVQSSAWEGLAAYPLELVQEALKEDNEEQDFFYQKIKDFIEKMDNKIADGISHFLTRLVSTEIQSIGRSLYIENDGFDYDYNRIIITGLKNFSWEKAMALNEIAALSAFGLYSESISPLGKRISVTLQRLYNAFIKVQIPLNDEWITLKYIIAWGKAIESVYKFLSEVSSDIQPNQTARAAPSDEIINVMKRAVATSNLALFNIVLALSFLITCARELNSAVKVAAEEFLLSCISPEYKCTTPALFRTDVNHNKELTVLSYFAVSRLFRKENLVANRSYDYFCQLINKNESFAKSGWLILASGGELDKAENSNVLILCRLLKDLDEIRDSKIGLLKWKPSEVQFAGLLNDSSSDLVDFIIDRLCFKAPKDKSVFTKWLEKETEFFNDVNDSSGGLMKILSGKLAKKLLGFLASGDSDVNAVALEELSSMYLLRGYQRISLKPKNYHYLCDSSVLRIIIQKLQENFNDSEADVFLAILQSLCGYSGRSDGRELPPLKWIFLYKIFSVANRDIQKCILRIAVRQQDVELLCKLVTSRTFEDNFLDFLELVLDNMDILQKITPQPVVKLIIDHLVKSTSEKKLEQQIWSVLASLAPQNQYVIESWFSKLPEITEVKVLDFPIYSNFKGVDIPYSMLCKNTLLHIWASTKSLLVEKNISLLVSLFKTLEKSPSRYTDQLRATALLVVAHNVIELTTEVRSQAIKWLITDFNLNGKRTFMDVYLYWRLFISFCSTYYSDEVPVFLVVESDVETWKWIESRASSVFQGILKDSNFLEISDEIANFIVSLLRLIEEFNEDDVDAITFKNYVNGKVLKIYDFVYVSELLQLMMSIIPSSTSKCLDVSQMWSKVFK